MAGRWRSPTNAGGRSHTARGVELRVRRRSKLTPSIEYMPPRARDAWTLLPPLRLRCPIDVHVAQQSATSYGTPPTEAVQWSTAFRNGSEEPSSTGVAPLALATSGASSSLLIVALAVTVRATG